MARRDPCRHHHRCRCRRTALGAAPQGTTAQRGRPPPASAAPEPLSTSRTHTAPAQPPLPPTPHPHQPAHTSRLRRPRRAATRRARSHTPPPPASAPTLPTSHRQSRDRRLRHQRSRHQAALTTRTHEPTPTRQRTSTRLWHASHRGRPLEVRRLQNRSLRTGRPPSVQHLRIHAAPAQVVVIHTGSELGAQAWDHVDGSVTALRRYSHLRRRRRKRPRSNYPSVYSAFLWARSSVQWSRRQYERHRTASTTGDGSDRPKPEASYAQPALTTQAPPGNRRRPRSLGRLRRTHHH